MSVLTGHCEQSFFRGSAESNKGLHGTRGGWSGSLEVSTVRGWDRKRCGCDDGKKLFACIKSCPPSPTLPRREAEQWRSWSSCCWSKQQSKAGPPKERQAEMDAKFILRITKIG
ncbi:hypothetical protein G6O67_001923 [Ophiocordyceps sinensis]|uniref:Uncharacterized protein n=1 Tax=Ophiocordyceps sinensis TaxID=72228 RepID=A0A8H4PT59_9HYPO|nr:hypothetical protein G6O67_001923 [Ophiocordyceps sinensis]